jgi:hypothetical protein
MLSGEIDFILKCVAPDLKAFQAFVAELTAAPHVRNVKTSLTLRSPKTRPWCRWSWCCHREHHLRLKQDHELNDQHSELVAAPCAGARSDFAWRLR